MPSSQTTLCKLLELGWHRTTSDSSGIRCGSPHQVFSCVQSGMVGMSTVTYPMADSTGYHSKRFSGITHSCYPSNSHCNRRASHTSFLVLSAFANTFVLEKMLMKSVMGYAVAAIAAYAIWFGVSKLMDESKPVHQNTGSSGVWHNGRQLGSFGGLGYHTIWQISQCFYPVCLR